jgi:hypothetical protein
MRGLCFEKPMNLCPAVQKERVGRVINGLESRGTYRSVAAFAADFHALGGLVLAAGFPSTLELVPRAELQLIS